MNAVWIEVPEYVLKQRAELGHDKRDECWEGVLHMVPPASFQHANFGFELSTYVRRRATSAGLVHAPDGIGIYAPDKDPLSWRIPDLALARPEQVSKRGFEGAVLVVEILSPHDESLQKFPFYARVGVQEIWLIQPYTRVPKIYVRAGDGFALVDPIDGVHRAPLLSITLEVIEGPRLRVACGDDRIDI